MTRLLKAESPKYYRRAGKALVCLGAGILLTGFLTSPLRAQPELERAFAFGSRLLECPTFNEPSVNYTMVLQTGGGPTAADQLQYNSARGWGYVVTGFATGGVRNRFGPFDASPNNRNNYSTSCPERLYDSFIGAKNFTKRSPP